MPERASGRSPSIAGFRRVLADYLLRGFLWSALAALLNQGATLLSSLLLARILGLQAFGHYSIVLSLVVAIATIAQGGSGLVAAKFIAEFRGSISERVSSILSLCRLLTFWTGVCGAAIVFLLAEPISISIYRNPVLVEPLRIGAAAVFFQTGVSFLQGGLQGFAAFDKLSRASLIAGILHIAFVAGGGLWGGLEGAVTGLSLASACRYVVYRYVLSVVARGHGVAPRGKLSTADVQLLWRFALPAGLSGFITVPAQSVVMAILARLPHGAELVGLYAAANQIRLMTLQVPAILNTVTISALSNLKGRAEHDEFRKLYLTNIAATLLAAAMVVVPLAAFLPQVFALYGEGFVVRGWFAYVLLLSVIPEVLSGAVYQLVQSAERMWHSLFLIAIPRDVGFVAVSYCLSAFSPLEGVGVAYLFGQAVSLAATMWIARTAFGRRLEGP